MNVFDYLALPSEEKTEILLESFTQLKRPANYWIDYEKVSKQIDDLGPDIYTLSYLIDKSPEILREFFTERPELLKLIPELLSISDSSLKRINGEKFLEVEHPDGNYELNFTTIDMANLNLYFTFLEDSGLEDLLISGLKESSHDYMVGVYSGSNTHARKNRGGKTGEAFLEQMLESISEETGYLWRGQTSYKDIQELYNITLPLTEKSKVFDGSLYNEQRRKLYVFEINIFNSTGSKIKGMAQHFGNIHSSLSSGTTELIYITDGKGWIPERNSLYDVVDIVGKVFNTQMVKQNFVLDYVK